MTFSVSEFSARLTKGGARPNLFEFRISFPGALAEQAGLASQQISFMAKAASVPSSTIGVAEVPYFGRVVNVAGDRTFDPFNVTVMMDEDYVVRDALESWSDAIKSHESNTATGNPSEYKIDFEVIHYGKEGSVIKTYKFVGGWPSTLGEVALAWDANNQIAEQPVTFTYDYWTTSITS